MIVTGSPLGMQVFCCVHHLRYYVLWPRIGSVKTLAGGEGRGNVNGVGKMATFYHPSGMSYDRKNRMLYVADQVIQVCFCFRLLRNMTFK